MLRSTLAYNGPQIFAARCNSSKCTMYLKEHRSMCNISSILNEPSTYLLAPSSWSHFVTHCAPSYFNFIFHITSCHRVTWPRNKIIGGTWFWYTIERSWAMTTVIIMKPVQGSHSNCNSVALAQLLFFLTFSLPLTFQMGSQASYALLYFVAEQWYKLSTVRLFPAQTVLWR